MEQNATIGNVINDLMSEIRPDAIAITDGFGFHDKALNSCIGRHDGNVYEALFDWARRSPMNKKEFQDSIYNKFLKRRLDKKFLAAGANAQSGGQKSKL